MTQIHIYLNVCDLTTDFGTQIFEQRIVELEKEGEHDRPGFIWVQEE